MKSKSLSKKAILTLLIASMAALAACTGGNSATPTSTSSPASSSSVSAEASASSVTEPVTGGTITVAIEADLPALDWTSSGSFSTANVAYHIYEQLFALDKDLSVKPMLADRYELSEDQLTYAIKLRQGVKFHNGAEMKADDVIASIDRWTVVSRFGKLAAEKIESIDKVDDYSFTIRLNEVYMPLIRFFAGPQNALVIMPAKIAEAAGDTRFTDDSLVVGTGPYKLESWQRGQRITLTRFDDYVSREEDWGGLTGKKVAYADKISFDIVSDPQVRVNGLRSGQFDYVMAVPQDLYSLVQTFEGVQTPVNEMKKFLTVIPDKSEAPFNDVRLRQAVNYALDRDAIGLVTYGDPNFYKVDPSIFFPPQKELYSTANAEAYAFDPEKAKQLMAEAGYNNEPIRIIASTSYDDHYKSAQIVMQQLQEVGFNVELQTYEYTTLTEMITQPGEFDLFVIGFAPVFDLPLTLWLEPGYAGSENYTSEAMNTVLDAWNSTGNAEEQKKLLEETNKIVYEEIPIVKLINEVGLDAYSDKLHDLPQWMGIIFWNTWVNE
ncbi:ABC transporter substrate-binding protein [Cohnella algarum]|uniref:ABC transporter substrate-binding protein n=1 Tax=Cohnella algarum TaxID=2044859 RepID=UPI0019678073|nr:ABC transporter substrate-binding protein [Cohnella algarum]MBN2984421.1 ABC transporter substrate-binding protein [Cohnella algarum]